jgi:hypothetical protein
MSTPAVPSTSRRRAPWRWAVAFVATGTLVVSGSGLVAFAQGGAGESRGPQFVPADAAVYVEARLDLPAGQDAALAQFLTAFPGFADPGAFQLKLDEALAAISAQVGASMPEGDLIGDVLTGEIGVGVSDLEATMDGSPPSLIVGLGVADPAAAASLFDALVAESGSTFTQETYADVEILTDDSSSQPLSVALDGDWLLLGTGSETVQAAVDVLDGSAESLAADPEFSAAWAQVPDGRLGAAYVDFTPLAGLIDAATQMAEGQTGMAMPAMNVAAMLPTDMVAWLEAADDRLNLEVVLTPGEQTPTLPVGESDVAAAFPADTQVFIETRELGATIEGALLQVQELMSSEAMNGGSAFAMPAEDIEVLFSEDSPFAAMLGAPLPQFLDFVGDAGIGAGLSSDGLWLGIAAEVNDPAVAEERLSSLLAMLTMFMAGAEEQGISIETETVGDVEVTNILIPFDEMMASSGVPLGLGDRLSIALDGDELLIGLGDFVESAILSDGSDSLATSASYLDAIGEDVPNSGVLYVDIASLVTALDPLLAMMGPEWAEIEPYLSALDSVVLVTTSEDGTMRSRMSLIAGA